MFKIMTIDDNGFDNTTLRYATRTWVCTFTTYLNVVPGL